MAATRLQVVCNKFIPTSTSTDDSTQAIPPVNTMSELKEKNGIIIGGGKLVRQRGTKRRRPLPARPIAFETYFTDGSATKVKRESSQQQTDRDEGSIPAVPNSPSTTGTVSPKDEEMAVLIGCVWDIKLATKIWKRGILKDELQQYGFLYKCLGFRLGSYDELIPQRDDDETNLAWIMTRLDAETVVAIMDGLQSRYRWDQEVKIAAWLKFCLEEKDLPPQLATARGNLFPPLGSETDERQT